VNVGVQDVNRDLAGLASAPSWDTSARGRIDGHVISWTPIRPQILVGVCRLLPGTGARILIIESTVGVAAMGLENNSLLWYVSVSALGLLGYSAGHRYSCSTGCFLMKELIAGAVARNRVGWIARQQESRMASSVISVGAHSCAELTIKMEKNSNKCPVTEPRKTRNLFRVFHFGDLSLDLL